MILFLERSVLLRYWIDFCFRVFTGEDFDTECEEDYCKVNIRLRGALLAKDFQIVN